MCLICDRISMIKDGTNPYFVKELETGYVVVGDKQHFKGYSIFLCKEHKTELFQLDYSTKMKFLEEMSIVAEAVSKAFDAEKMNYELLGNGDTHLHWHLFPRVSGDIEIIYIWAYMIFLLDNAHIFKEFAGKVSYNGHIQYFRVQMPPYL